MQALEKRIFSIENDAEFNSLALDIFDFQARENKVYSTYIDFLKIDPKKISSYEDIPFLPIEFYKKHRIISGKKNPVRIFESSGTSGQQTSKHYLLSESLYLESFSKTFRKFYGNPEDKCILALLPSYLERGSSSLVYMMDHLIRSSSHPESGFYLNNLDELALVLERRTQDKSPTLLLGVSFALLDLAEKFPQNFSDNIIIMETGGMKGRKKEMIREELHAILKQAFQVNAIHSEYGMTELLSQAYSSGEGRFKSPAWMKVLIRDSYDPLSILPGNQAGGINIVDLANIYSCSFIATEDMGKTFDDGSFEISGRLDVSDVRGCNLMVV